MIPTSQKCGHRSLVDAAHAALFVELLDAVNGTVVFLWCSSTLLNL
jgi:hypothetical protein